jgi:hypothetical protein
VEFDSATPKQEAAIIYLQALLEFDLSRGILFYNPEARGSDYIFAGFTGI